MEEVVVASQSQTSISSEADISRRQRGSQEPSSEFALHPLDSGGDLDNQEPTFVVHVDSSESLQRENITPSVSATFQSLAEEEEQEGGRGEVEESKGANAALISSGSVMEGETEGERLAHVVVGTVEPDKANQQPKLEELPPLQEPEPQQQLQEELAEQEQTEPVEPMEEREREMGEAEDREAVGDVREREALEEEEEETGVVEHIEEGARVQDATREQADTTQRLEEGIVYPIEGFCRVQFFHC